MQGIDRVYTSMSDKIYDMYKNAELYKATRTNPDKYEPVTNTATVDLAVTQATVTVKDFDKVQGSLQKYFGTTDTYSIYVPAAEQEYGAGKKRPAPKEDDEITYDG